MRTTQRALEAQCRRQMGHSPRLLARPDKPRAALPPIEKASIRTFNPPDRRGPSRNAIQFLIDATKFRRARQSGKKLPAARFGASDALAQGRN